MPPKGWRKNADGQYPQPSSKENELISIDDILFPRTTIQKLAKNIISDDENNTSQMTIAKDSLLALQRSATVFVSHLLFQAKQISKEANRKTVSAQDMLAALERAEFSGFIPEVKQKLSVFEANVASKKQLKAAKAISTTEGGEKSTLKKPKLDNESMEIDADDVNVNGDEDDDNSADENEDDDENSKQDIENGDEQEEDGDDDNDETEEDVSNPISALAKEEQELQGVETEPETEDKPDSSETEEEED